MEHLETLIVKFNSRNVVKQQNNTGGQSLQHCKTRFHLVNLTFDSIHGHNVDNLEYGASL